MLFLRTDFVLFQSPVYKKKHSTKKPGKHRKNTQKCVISRGCFADHANEMYVGV